MNDKNFARFMFVAATLLVFWWYWRKTHTPMPVAASNTPWTMDPELLTYASNPAAFGPSTVNGTVNINVSGYNGLNQNYMPLFGFVGMAQGDVYH